MMMVAEIKQINLIDIIKKDLDKPLNQYFMTLVEEYKMTLIEKYKSENIQIWKEEGKIEMILALYDDGISIGRLSKASQLSEDEVLDILKTHHKF